MGERVSSQYITPLPGRSVPRSPELCKLLAQTKVIKADYKLGMINSDVST